MSKPFRITGYHVLAGMVGFFLIIIAVNSVFISYAVKSFPGEQEKKSYLQGINFNDRLAARKLQSTIGWTVEIEKAELEESGASAIIELSFKDKAHFPIDDLNITAQLSRPVDNNDDQSLQFTSINQGRYQAIAENVAAGVWLLRLHSINTNNEIFELETELYLE